MFKKIIIPLLFLGFGSQGFAQVTYESLDRHPDVQGPMAFQWDGWKEEVSEKEAISRLEKIVPNKLLKGFDKDLQERTKHTHFADFDGDGDYDIIYSGQYHKKMNRPVTLFLENRGSDFRLISKFNGSLAQILRMNGRVRRARFVILDEAYKERSYSRMSYLYFSGQAANTQSVLDLSPNKLHTQFNSDSLGASVVRQFVYVSGTEFPESMGDVPLKVARSGAYMTPRPGNPDNDDFSQKMSVFSDSLIAKNKAIAIPKMGTTCRAIGISSKNNRTYYMVAIKLRQKENNYFDGFEEFILGWIDAEYVQKQEARSGIRN